MSFEELSVEVVDSMSIPSMTRATSRIEWNISPDTVMKADTASSPMFRAFFQSWKEADTNSGSMAQSLFANTFVERIAQLNVT